MQKFARDAKRTLSKRRAQAGNVRYSRSRRYEMYDNSTANSQAILSNSEAFSTIRRPRGKLKCEFGGNSLPGYFTFIKLKRRSSYECVPVRACARPCVLVSRILPRGLLSNSYTK